jgi:hypothetical protein
MNQAEYNACRSEVYNYISDASKDAVGSRFRFDYTQFTLVQLEMKADYWAEAANEVQAQHGLDQDSAIVAFEALIAETISMGAGDRETAVRWIMESEDDNINKGDKYINYTFNLPYSYNYHTGTSA